MIVRVYNFMYRQKSFRMRCETMNRTSFYAALFLILAGALLLVKTVFRLSFSVLGVLFGLALLVLGISLLLGKGGNIFRFSDDKDGEKTVVFGRSVISGPGVDKVNSIFSSVDWTPDLTSGQQMREMNAVFGSGRLVVPDGFAVTVTGSAAFGSFDPEADTGLTIYGVTDSAAEAYAEENGLNFVAE